MGIHHMLTERVFKWDIPGIPTTMEHVMSVSWEILRWGFNEALLGIFHEDNQFQLQICLVFKFPKKVENSMTCGCFFLALGDFTAINSMQKGDLLIGKLVHD